MTPPRLIAIPISHFCEKARWALERAEIDYVEERHLQGFHHFFTMKARGGLTTPVLCFDDGRVISQSSEILRWTDTQLEPEDRLYPEDIAARVRTVEHWLDVTLGPDGRAWLYGQLLESTDLIKQYGLEGIPEFERRSFDVAMTMFKPYIAARIRLQGSNPDISAVYGIYDEIAARLEDGRPFLIGDRFTAADLTFAALSAPLVLPDRYGVELPPLRALPAAMQTKIEDLREHPAGQFALRMIETERPLPKWMSSRPQSFVAQ
jgi:glutathione S-transferase